jgi:hypothetical protein
MYICWPKKHDQGFKEAIAGAYGCRPDILTSYPDEAIGITNINFGKVFYFGEPGQHFSN